MGRRTRIRLTGRRTMVALPTAALLVVAALGLRSSGSPTADAATLTLTGTRSSSPLKVVVLGDSVPAGGACNCTPLPALAAQTLGSLQHRTVQVTNLAVGGSTSADVVRQLRNTGVRQEVADADLVIVETGTNDFDSRQATRAACRNVTACYGSQLAATTANLRSIVNTVDSLQGSSAARVSVVGYWNVFKDGAVGRAQGSNYVRSSDALTQALNASIRSVAAAHAASYPDVYPALKGVDGTTDPTRYLAADGDHPNATGHRLPAQAVVAALGESVRKL